jgi:MoxR-like ATPase
MEERQVTIEGKTRELPSPFFVIATQNPNSQAGTFPLPESQLDRFLMRIELGYPDPAAERILMEGADRREMLLTFESIVDEKELLELQRLSSQVKVSDSLLDYIQRLVAYTRSAPEFAYGLSPRGALALLRCAKSWTLIEGRSHVVPEDVQAIVPCVVEHRLRETADFTGHGGSALAQRLLSKVDIIA